MNEKPLLEILVEAIDAAAVARNIRPGLDFWSEVMGNFFEYYCSYYGADEQQATTAWENREVQKALQAAQEFSSIV